MRASSANVHDVDGTTLGSLSETSRGWFAICLVEGCPWRTEPTLSGAGGQLDELVTHLRHEHP